MLPQPHALKLNGSVFNGGGTDMTRLMLSLAMVIPLVLPLHAQAMTQTEVAGGDGVPLAVYETGNLEGPEILFIHGFTQSHLTWMEQVSSDLADEFRLIMLDLRGHGASAKPLEPEYYADPALWAADIDAVIRAKELENPVLVGWSLGGVLIADYLHAHGDERVAGVVFNGAFVNLQTGDGTSVLPDDAFAVLRAMAAPDLQTRFEATQAFVGLLTRNDPGCAARERMLGSSMMVPAEVRASVLSRHPPGADESLSALDLPVLAVHGSDDAIITVQAAEHIVDLMPGAELVVYDGIGHTPHQEETERFNADLRAFVRDVNGAAGSP